MNVRGDRDRLRQLLLNLTDNRRVEKLEPEEQAAVRSAQRAVKSKRGKKLLARRGMHERGFAHILDCGGNEADNAESTAKPEQTIQTGSRRLQLIAIDEEIVRNRHPEAARSLWACPFFAIFPSTKSYYHSHAPNVRRVYIILGWPRDRNQQPSAVGTSAFLP